jgi:hypothetical protein
MLAFIGSTEGNQAGAQQRKPVSRPDLNQGPLLSREKSYRLNQFECEGNFVHIVAYRPGTRQHLRNYAIVLEPLLDSGLHVTMEVPLEAVFSM